MRFRKDGADCLFNHHNYYDNPMSLNTDAEMTVTDGHGEFVAGPLRARSLTVVVETDAEPVTTQFQPSDRRHGE